MTIQQLQTFVDTNPDVRQLVNEVVDYLQANPSGGGGGSAPTLDQVLAAGATLAEDRTIDLNAHTLFFKSQTGVDYNFFFGINPTDTAVGILDPYTITGEVSSLDGSNIAGFKFSGASPDDDSYFQLHANRGSNLVQIDADAGDDRITYTAGLHKVEGDMTLEDLVGGGTTGASIDDTGKIIRTP